jgi:formylglycine-generating enzyme required for sulfatase activity
MPFIFVKGGEFWIGATPRDRDALKYERPRHRIRLNDFWLGKFPVTQEEWLSVVEENCFEFPGEKRRPAECVQWIDIYSKFIQKLGGGLRFPTEAEWEIAARGGLDSKSRYGPLKEIAWYEENSQEKTHPVGLKKPNPFGFYDMIGNVWEFCQDKWDKAAYDTRQGISGNPCNQDLTKRNVVGRGGSYLESPEYLRASARDKFEPNAQYCTAGFRLACSIRPKDE